MNHSERMLILVRSVCFLTMAKDAYFIEIFLTQLAIYSRLLGRRQVDNPSTAHTLRVYWEIEHIGMVHTRRTKLEEVRNRTWFYEFDLPDGTRTSTDVPDDVRPIHTSRRDKLTQVIRDRVENPQDLTAVDFAAHEGYYTIELSRHFKSVVGYEYREESLAAARLITDVLGVRNVKYVRTDLQKMEFDEGLVADFVLVYGLIYHLENPIHVIRLASQLASKHILVETQILPYEVSGVVEDGSWMSLRRVEGVFALSPDYSTGREGGSTDIALVPSLNSLLYLLRNFGFSEVSVLPTRPSDYEQFRRGSRVILYGKKS